MNRSLIVICVMLTLSTINAYHILVAAPHPITGHWLFFEEFIKELLDRGHAVTAITSYNVRYRHANYSDYVVQALNLEEHYPSKNFFLGSYEGVSQNIWMNWKIGLLNSENVFKNPKVQSLIKSDNQMFDLVIVDQFYQESLYLFAHKFNCPLVTVAPQGYTQSMDWSMGFLTPWTFIPHHNLPYVENMTFLQRANNVLISMYDVLFRRFNYIRAQNELAKEYFKEGINGDIPRVREMEKEISLMLVNDHQSDHQPRPKMPGQIDITGAHIKPALALPNELQHFMDSATDGVIVFSLGTYIKSHEMPQEKLSEIVEAFKGIKQKVIWKFEGSTSFAFPSNVLVQNWIPQSDVLAHPKVVLFISHGGVLGVQEAVHRGIPMMLIPFTNEQQKIASSSQKSGYGLVMKFDDIKADTFAATIDQIVNDPSFKKQAFEASALSRDKIVSAMDEAIFWIEYAIRHKGAKHLKSPSVNMSVCKYLMFDVIVFYCAISIIVFLLWAMAIKICIRRCRAKEEKGKFKYY